MLRCRWPVLGSLMLAFALHAGVRSDVLAQGKGKPPSHPKQGSGIVIELDNAFIEKYMDRALIETDFKPVALSKVHPAKSDGEIHVAGHAEEVKLTTVVEVMNAANKGGAATQLLRAAKNAGQTVKVTGAWRLWCEHAGTLNQIQGKPVKLPQPGVPPSNPDHVFEIHPVTVVTAGTQVADATDSVGRTPGFRPKDAHAAFVLAYEKVPCKLVALSNDRTRIITKGVGFNFVDFQIRLMEDPSPTDANDGHLVMASVRDTDGELLVRRRRMVFMKGTDADELVQGMKEGARLRVIGIPRISLKLVQWRIENKDSKEYDTSPLEWDLPYEMIIVAATRVAGDDD